ncbi:hypothetical protein bcgnr5384_56960 [Bacillus cereus]
MDKVICINMTCPLRLRCHRYSGPLDFTGDFYAVEWLYPECVDNSVSCEQFIPMFSATPASAKESAR